jgi:hypothetical protein
MRRLSCFWWVLGRRLIIGIFMLTQLCEFSSAKKQDRRKVGELILSRRVTYGK